jgi:Skp family chaperone for outer membrane proteins
MPNLENMRDEVSNLTKKVQREVRDLLGLYKSFQEEIEARFREELREQDGKMEGLEDFYGLNLLLKRNFQNVGNATTLLSRLKDFSGFDISEEELERIEKKMEIEQELEKVEKKKNKIEKEFENLVKES